VVHKTSWKLSRTFLKKANDNHIDNDCFERESLESLWMEPLTKVPVFPAPQHILGPIQILSSSSKPCIFKIIVQIKGQGRPTHNVFMDSILLSGG